MDTAKLDQACVIGKTTSNEEARGIADDLGRPCLEEDSRANSSGVLSCRDRPRRPGGACQRAGTVAFSLDHDYAGAAAQAGQPVQILDLLVAKTRRNSASIAFNSIRP